MRSHNEREGRPPGEELCCTPRDPLLLRISIGPGYGVPVAHTDSLSVTVNAPAAQVLAFLRDIDNQKNWLPGNKESEVLERDAQGLPTRARLVQDAILAKDEFMVDYTHGEDSMSWEMVKPTSVQKTHVGSWRVADKGDELSEATMTLTVDTSLPLPSFVQKRVMRDTLKGATSGLAKQF